MNEETVLAGTNSATLRCEGDLVAAALAVLRSRLKEAVASGVLRLTLDLEETQMVDSAGLGLLISTHNTLKKAGGELEVIHASKDILDLFRTMRINQHFRVS